MLFYKLRKKNIENRLAHWDEEKEVLKYEQAFKKVTKGGRPKISTSKIILGIMIAILAVVMIFTGYATASMLSIVMLTGAAFDFTPLTGLIAAVVGEVVVTLGYFAKSAKENSVNGITYQSMMNEFEAQQNIDYGADER